MSTTEKGIRYAMAALLVVASAALVAYALAAQGARGAGGDGPHEHSAHREVGFLEAAGGAKVWMSYDFDPTVPESLADNVGSVYFAEVVSVGPEYELPQPEGDTFGEPQPTAQDLKVVLTEDAVKGDKTAGQTLTVSREPLNGAPNPAAGERWMFFTNAEFYDPATDTSSGRQIVQVQPYGEKKVADDAERDRLYQAYYGPSNNNTTYSEPPAERPDGLPVIAEYCTDDAPAGCETGTLP